MKNSASPLGNNPNAAPEKDGDLKHVLAVLKVCHEYSSALGVQISDISGLWSASLFVRSIVALNSVITLIRAKANDDAAIIVRTMFEIEFQLGAIKAEPKIATDLIKRTEAYRGARLSALIKSKRELPQGIKEEGINEQLDLINASDVPADIQKSKLAEKAGLSYEYKTIYSILCDIAHVSPMGLAHYLNEDEATGKLRVNPNGSLLDSEYLMVLAAATQLNILGLAVNILNDVAPSEFQELRRQNSANIQKIHAKMFEEQNW